MKAPICEECNITMTRFAYELPCGWVHGWSCDECGWSEDDADVCIQKATTQEQPTYEKLKEEIDFMRYLITQVLNALPTKRDWLDPEIEAGMKSMCNPMMVRFK